MSQWPGITQKKCFSKQPIIINCLMLNDSMDKPVLYTLCSKLLCKSRFSRYFEKYFSKTNKTFTTIAFYYDQPLVIIWTKFDNKLFGYDVYAKKVPFPLFQIIMQIKSLSLTKLKMGKQKDLTEEEKSTIVRCLAEGRKSTESAKELCRDHGTVKRFIANADRTRKRCDKGLKRKTSRRQMSAIKREAVKQSLFTI